MRPEYLPAVRLDARAFPARIGGQRAVRESVNQPVDPLLTNAGSAGEVGLRFIRVRGPPPGRAKKGIDRPL
jgi:hypothetical protein